MSNLAEEWNNWPRYREIIIALFASRRQLHLINPESTFYGFIPSARPGYDYHHGLWYEPGIIPPSIPKSEFEYLTSRSAGILLLHESLPACLYDQALHCGEVWQKWEFWNTTYAHRQEAARTDAAGSSISEPQSPAPASANTQTPRPRTVLSNEANGFLLDKLTQYPKYGGPADNVSPTPLPSIHEHLTLMLVIYEGLESRNVPIPERDLIPMIHDTLSRVPAFHAFVAALDTQAKRCGLPNVSVYDLVEAIAAYEKSVGKENVALMLQHT